MSEWENGRDDDLRVSFGAKGTTVLVRRGEWVSG